MSRSCQGARERAVVEGLDVTFAAGDAERLPCPDASFDAVLSCLGVMFTPRHQQAARELVCVCRPRGTIALANWTPAGFVGRMFQTRPELHSAVFEYIEAFYNRQRRHSGLETLSRVAYQQLRLSPLGS
jgi:ubiquinone/menaquinone biosynthesis C-methylase UbiE